MGRLEKRFEHIIIAVLYLAENNSALRASSNISYTAHNSYFRGLIELTAKFDPFSKRYLLSCFVEKINKEPIFVAFNSTSGSATGQK